MRRWVFYLFIGLSAFGIGSLIVVKYFRQTEKIAPNNQVIKPRSYGDFWADLRRNTIQTSVDKSPSVQPSSVKKKTTFTCNNKIFSSIITDLRKKKWFNEVAENYSEQSESWDCQDILFIAQSVDLNGDRINEFVVRGKTSLLCGATGNCSMWIYKKFGKSYKKLLDTGGEFLTVKRNSTNGYKNIFVRDHESASESYQSTYKFSKGKYQEAKCLFVDNSFAGNKIITTCAEESARIEEEYERQKNL